jgi:hypothetical protein
VKYVIGGQIAGYRESLGAPERALNRSVASGIDHFHIYMGLTAKVADFLGREVAEVSITSSSTCS